MGILRSGIDMYTLYSIIRKLATPFTEWKAYKLGVIDEKGNILIPVKKRNQEQYYSLTYLDIFVRNLKMVLQKVPGMNNKFVTYGAALWLLREDRYAKMDMILEDGTAVGGGVANSSGGLGSTTNKKDKNSIPTNNMSSGQIAKNDINIVFGSQKKILKRFKDLDK